jgi:hypothetical protein
MAKGLLLFCGRGGSRICRCVCFSISRFFFFFFGFYSCGSATLVFSCQILRFVGFGDVRTRIYVFGDVGIELRYKRSRICVKFFILWGLMMRVWIILQSLICFYWFCFNGAQKLHNLLQFFPRP